MIIEKRCTHCSVIKPITEFHIDTWAPDGLAFGCKDCKNQYNRKYHKKWRASLRARIHRSQPISERLDFYTFYSPDGCWYWTGSVRNGYGTILIPDKKVPVSTHRLSYQFHKGPIPDGLFVCHRCDNPLCINPDHLFLGTAADNNQDRTRKGRGRAPKGPSHRNSKFTESDIINIRSSSLMPSQIAKKYSVAHATIANIVRRKSYKDI